MVTLFSNGARLGEAKLVRKVPSRRHAVRGVELPLHPGALALEFDIPNAEAVNVALFGRDPVEVELENGQRFHVLCERGIGYSRVGPLVTRFEFSAGVPEGWPTE